MASKTSGEKPVASKIRSNWPCCSAASRIVVRRVLVYCAPMASTSSAFRLGGSSSPKVITSRPRTRRAAVARSPIVPAPSTAARRGCQILSRRWISYAWVIPFSTTLVGSSRTPTSPNTPGTRIRYSGSSTYRSVRKPWTRLMPCSK